MKTRLLFKLCFCIVFFTACGSGDDNDTNDPSDNFITVNMTEYPTSGDLITVINSSLPGTISYSISFETVSQAAIINGNELRVGDWLAFDFETNETLFVNVEVSNESEIEVLEYRIEITNVDDIWAFLNGSSRTAYENANNGDWVLVAESEYNDLANYLAATNRSGATVDQIYNNNASIENYLGDRTIANDNDTTIPENSYVFAFKYYSWVNNVNSSKVKLSLGDAGGLYADLGNVLPQHNDEYNHFVLKGATIPTASEAYIGMYASGAIGVKNDNGNNYKWRNGDVDNLDNTANGSVFLLQGLSTTLKQWD